MFEINLYSACWRLSQLTNVFPLNLEVFADQIAIITASGEPISYTALAELTNNFSSNFPKNSRQLFLLEADNSLESIVAYLSALRSNLPVILIPHDKSETFENVFNQFQPTLSYRPQHGQYLFEQHLDTNIVNQDFPINLSVLLSTSGTTGSTKLVRLSSANINANAQSIVEYLHLSPSERAIVSLPMYYSYGLSVINSHLSIGASLVLCSDTVVEDHFWQTFNRHSCTSFAGVPYSYELLKSSSFENKLLPSLRYMTQAGGKLPKELVEYYAKLGQQHGWLFYVMYGQTEATARMSYLPPEHVISDSSSIGIAIPQGYFELIDETGQIIKSTQTNGELVYHGPNVMLGYANTLSDLLSSSSLTALHTGDIAWRDERGFYYISGRKNRFLKIFGNRISLDEIETFIRALGYVVICGGIDAHFFVMTIDTGKALEIAHILAEKFGLTSQYVTVVEVTDFPLLPSGKVDYKKLVDMSEAKVLHKESIQPKPKQTLVKKLFSKKNIDSNQSAELIFSTIFNSSEVAPSSTFKQLGGDSLNYVQMLMLLEKKLGQVPVDWQTLTVQEIEALNPVKPGLWQSIKTSIVLRALAILGVLLNHTGEIPSQYINGGAACLMMLTGYSFARFQLTEMLNGTVWKTTGLYLKKVIVPYLMISIAYILYRIHIKGTTADYDFLLMISNFYRYQQGNLEPMWFIQVLVQCFVILGIIFSIQSFVDFAKKDIWKSSIFLLIIISIMSLLINFMWDTQNLGYRLPHIYMPLIMIGWCAHLAKTKEQQFFVVGYALQFLIVGVVLNIWQPAHFIWLLSAVSLIVFLPKMPVLFAIKNYLILIAASAYSIYLIHMWLLYIIKYFIHTTLLKFIILTASCIVVIATYSFVKDKCKFMCAGIHFKKVFKG